LIDVIARPCQVCPVPALELDNAPYRICNVLTFDIIPRSLVSQFLSSSACVMRPITKFRIPLSGPSISAPVPATRFQHRILSTFRSRPQPISNYSPAIFTSSSQSFNRVFSSTNLQRKEDYTARAKELHQKSADEHEDDFHSQIDNAMGQAKELQTRTPWHREGSDKPPVKRMRSAGAVTKGLSPSILFPKAPSCQYLAND
jgi:hypothetical protein